MQPAGPGAVRAVPEMFRLRQRCVMSGHPMSTWPRHAMILGAELDRTNALRRIRSASLMAVFGYLSESQRARGLMYLARIDRRRRDLRDLLADALEAAAEPAARPAYTGPNPDDLLPGSREYWRALHAKFKAEGRFDGLPDDPVMPNG